MRRFRASYRVGIRYGIRAQRQKVGSVNGKHTCLIEVLSDAPRDCWLCLSRVIVGGRLWGAFSEETVCFCACCCVCGCCAGTGAAAEDAVASCVWAGAWSALVVSIVIAVAQCTRKIRIKRKQKPSARAAHALGADALYLRSWSRKGSRIVEGGRLD